MSAVLVKLIKENVMAKGQTNKKSVVALPTDAEMRSSGLETLSARIRHLMGLGVSIADITKIVKRENGESPRYQHVRNVAKTPLKRPADSGNAANAG